MSRRLGEWLSQYDWPAILGAAFVVAAVFLLTVPTHSTYDPSAPYAEQNTRDKAADVGASKTSDDRVADYTLWLTLFTGLLFVASLWQGWLILRAEGRNEEVLKVSVAQAASAAAAVEVARDIGQKQVRAYLAGDGGTFTIHPMFLACEPRIRNYGQSPATNVKVRARLWSTSITMKDGMPESQNFRTEFFENNCSPVPANGVASPYLVWLRDLVTDTFWDFLTENPNRVNVDCEITWDDVFEKTESMWFTVRAKPEDRTGTFAELIKPKSVELVSYNRDPHEKSRDHQRDPKT